MTLLIQSLNENILPTRLSPILKWAGGKEQELKHIHPAMPREFNRYFEPFIGGGLCIFLSTRKVCLLMTNLMN